jgi:hypothetical protein
MYRDPIIWNDSSQLTADTIFLETENKKPRLAHLKTNSFVVEHVEDQFYNQMKGNNTFIYFKSGNSDKMISIGKAESAYYGKEDGKGIQGLNLTQSEEIISYFEDKKVSRIQFIQKPNAIFIPIQNVTNDKMYLQGYKWKDDLRPRKYEDL